MKDNQFIVEVRVPFPSGPDGQRVEQWLNTQHAGKPQIPLDEEVSDDHSYAHSVLHMNHIMSVMVEVDKNGHWKFLEIK
jgi:hypothetical protein